MAWFLLHREGLSLMDGEFEVRHNGPESGPYTVDLTTMAKSAGTMRVDLSKPRPASKPTPTPSKEEHPRGVWLWELSKLPRDYLDRLVKCGVGRVYLKVFDDASKGDGFWSWQCTPEIIKSFNDKGIEVWGWGYHFDRRTSIKPFDQQAALKKAKACGLAGYVVDVEQEVKDPKTHSDLGILLEALKQVFPGKLGYTSFGAPQFHPEIPWKLLDQCCDLALPQIYYEKFSFSNDISEVVACIHAHEMLGLTKPLLPIFGSESDTKDPATSASLQKFLNQYPGASVWRAPNAGERGEAFNLDYRGTPQGKPDDADTPSLRERVCALARERCSKGRQHAPGNVIDVEVVDPLRPAMVRLGHLGAGDKDSFVNWCACNVTKIYRDCGIKVPDVPLVNGKPFWATAALVDTYAAWAKSIGAWRAAKDLEPGDACVYDWDGNGSYDHIGIVLKNNGGSFLVAEGNKGNREVIITRDASLLRGGVNVEMLARSLA